MWEKWNIPVRISSSQETSKYGMPESAKHKHLLKSSCLLQHMYSGWVQNEERKRHAQKEIVAAEHINWLLKCGWEPAEWTVFAIFILFIAILFSPLNLQCTFWHLRSRNWKQKFAASTILSIGFYMHLRNHFFSTRRMQVSDSWW